MSAGQQLAAGVGMVAVFELIVWAKLAGGPVSSRGRHRRGSRRWVRVDAAPDVFDRVLAAALDEPETVDPEVVEGVLLYLAHREGQNDNLASDDWTADLPTVEFPVVRHTSPTETLRGRYELESPIFTALAKELGFDPVRGFDALFDAELVAA